MDTPEQMASQPDLAKHDCTVLDLAFAMDCTGSMGPYIDTAQKNIRKIVEDIVSSEKSDIHLALVEYRDHPPQDFSFVTRLHDFTSSVSEMKSWLDESFAQGGGDCPEAVADALHDILNLSWRPEATKICILISDAPPHGLSSWGDNFPNGCPAGFDPVRIVRELAEKGVTLYSVGCEPAILPFKEFFTAIAYITGGQYVPLQGAKALTQIIVGSAQEEMSLERWMAEVDEEVRREMNAGNRIDDNEMTFRVQAKMQSKGMRSKTLQRNNLDLEAPSASSVQLAGFSSMADVKAKFNENRSNTGSSFAFGSSSTPPFFGSGFTFGTPTTCSSASFGGSTFGFGTVTTTANTASGGGGFGVSAPKTSAPGAGCLSFGAPTSSSTPPFFGSGFNFSTTHSTSGIGVFGLSAPETTSAPPGVSGFSFGGPTSSSSTSFIRSGFTFGTPTTSSSASFGGSTFGFGTVTTTANTASGGGGFGVSAPKTTTSAPSGAGCFSFGAPASSTSAPFFGSGFNSGTPTNFSNASFTGNTFGFGTVTTTANTGSRGCEFGFSAPKTTTSAPPGASGFSFGGSTSSTSAPFGGSGFNSGTPTNFRSASFGGNTFGFSAVTTTANSAPGIGGFGFSAPTTTSSPSELSGFSFGGPTSTSAPFSGSGFNFGTPATSSGASIGRSGFGTTSHSIGAKPAGSGSSFGTPAFTEAGNSSNNAMFGTVNSSISFAQASRMVQKSKARNRQKWLDREAAGIERHIL